MSTETNPPGRPPRPNLTRATHLAAAKTIATFISIRSKLSNSDIESIMSMGTEVYSKRSGVKKSGSTWAKYRRGESALAPMTLARVAHEALARGWLTPDDLIDLHTVPGGTRMLNTVQDLLLAMKSGKTLSRKDIDAHYRKWCDSYDTISKGIAAEKGALFEGAEKAAVRLHEAMREVESLRNLIQQARHHEAGMMLTPELVAQATCDPEESTDPVLHSLDVFAERLLEAATDISDIRFEEVPLLGINDFPSPKPTRVRDKASAQLTDEWFQRNEAALVAAATPLPQNAVDHSHLDATALSGKVQ